MRRFIKAVILVALISGGLYPVSAFTLLGPAADWMTQRLGYDLNAPAVGGGAGAGVGGPMALGEEYRWNVPTIYYGFSPAFQSFFGLRGVTEVEKAIQLLAELPSMDTVNIDDYPLASQRINYQAQALGVVDIRSYVLSFLVQTLGITDPTRYVFTLRNRFIINSQPTNYFVIKRNYDPATWEPTSFINGQLWTYTSILDGDVNSLAVNETVDPLALGGLINAPVASGIANNLLLTGGFWTGLTRDDVGGLRYIYRSSNFNVENAAPNATTGGFGAVTSGGGGSPWTIPVITPPPGTGTGGPTVPGGGTNFIVSGPRPGIAKFEFVRVGTVGGAFVSNTVAYTDTVIANGSEVQQTLVRPLVVPDIIFDAGDLQVGDTFDQGYQAFFNSEQAWVTNGLANFGPGKYGPGVINPSAGTTAAFVLTLQSLGPTFFSVYPFALSEATSTFVFRWGSFDGSTNAPVVYPSGESIIELENDVFGGGGLGGGALVQTWTPAVTVLLPPGTTTGGGTGGTDPNAGTTP